MADKKKWFGLAAALAAMVAFAKKMIGRGAPEAEPSESEEAD